MADFDFETIDYSKLRESLAAAHSEYGEGLLSEEGEGQSIRPLDEASSVLTVIEKIGPELQGFLRTHQHFLPLFEKAWGGFEKFNDREHLYELCFVEQFLFPENQHCPLGQEFLGTYQETFRQWMKTAEAGHITTQRQLRESFSPSLSPKDLPCQCVKCTGDFRSQLREHLAQVTREEILQAAEDFKSLSLELSREEFVGAFHALTRSIDRRLGQAKFKLRRGSLNRLKTQIDSWVQEFFSYESETLATYRGKLDQLVVAVLREKGLNPTLVDEGQRLRFFQQRGRGIWRRDQALMQEIGRLVQSVLALKRKDISAKILQDYLGQFWVHSEARGLRRKVVYHMGPTNSGKTYHAIQCLAQVARGCYLAPLRLLATELYDTLNDMGVRTTLLTGEEVIEVEEATHFSSTIEMVKLHEQFEMCVIDEIQMINDPQRGWAWTRALVSIQAPEIHICGDPTALELVQKICGLCDDELEVKEYQRMTDLQVLPHKIKADALERHDAVIVFSRRNALRYKRDLERLDYKVSIVYGRLSPEVRREQARKFDQGETDIIVSTDAISMGMNLPIKRVIFTTLSKFIDSKEIPITSSEIKQISGRAGRYKRYPTGFISTLDKVEGGLEKVHQAMAEEAPQKAFAMVGPDLDIFAKVNHALQANALPELGLSEFLRLFNTMQFEYPFYCVDLKEMIEISEMVEQADDRSHALSDAEVFGFSCAPVNLGLPEHVQYFLTIVGRYVNNLAISYEKIDHNSDDIDYLETSIKCLELYQWLARHFQKRHFDYDELELLHNKGQAIEKLNSLLSEKISLTCMVCGCKLPPKHEFAICETCFKNKRFRRRRPHSGGGSQGNDNRAGTKGRSGGGGGGGSRVVRAPRVLVVANSGPVRGAAVVDVPPSYKRAMGAIGTRRGELPDRGWWR